MKIPLYFFPIGPTDTLYKMIKTLLLGSPGISYGMIEERVVASFKHILDTGFGDDSASVLETFSMTEKWEWLYGTSCLQRKFSDHASSVNSQLLADILRVHDPEAREITSLWLKLSFNFL